MPSLRIALYCPNKPLDHTAPSGDLTIAQSLLTDLRDKGHDCREIVRFRSRWFWRSPANWKRLALGYAYAWRTTRSWCPHIWLTYHTYYKSPDVIGPVICRCRRIPYVLFQPMYATKRRRHARTRIGFYLNRIALRSASHAFTNNLLDIPALQRALPANAITYLPPGIFPEEFQRSEAGREAIRQRFGISGGTHLLVSVARFRPGVKYESLVYLFRALHLLYRERVPFKLLIIGDGPKRQDLHTMAEAWIPNRSIFAGQIPRKQLPDYYSAADLFVFPGIGESLGMVYLEAQSCGCPVVALKTAGVPQVVVHGRTGFLVPPNDTKSMARAVKALLQSPTLRNRLGSNAREFIKNERNLRINYEKLSGQLGALARRSKPASNLR